MDPTPESAWITPESVDARDFDSTKFREGYDQDQVDAFLDDVKEALRWSAVALEAARSGAEAPARPPGLLGRDDLVNKDFDSTKFREGYDQDQVDEFLDQVAATMTAIDAELGKAAAARAWPTVPNPGHGADAGGPLAIREIGRRGSLSLVKIPGRPAPGLLLPIAEIGALLAQLELDAPHSPAASTLRRWLAEAEQMSSEAARIDSH